MSDQVLYGFAARGIQDYLFRSNKLKEIIGASELIETLPGESVFGKVAEQFLGGYKVLTRAAGGIRVICDDGGKAQEFAKIWPLVAARYAPGLELTQAIVPLAGNLAQAIQTLEQQLAINRQAPCVALPEAGPLVERNRRTGLPADRKGKDADGKDGYMDAESARKLSMQTDANKRLVQRLWPEDLTKRPQNFQDNFDKLVGERDYLAIVHADANGMGVALNELAEQLKDRSVEDARKAYQGFSKAVATATQTAMCKALEELMPAWALEDKKKYFARPIVCAGDDLTVVLRSRDAFRFAELYAQQLEDQSTQLLNKLATKPRQPLTAAVAILCIRPGYPFRRAYDLLESMCAYAKGKSRTCSSLIFARVTAEAPDSFDDLIKQELTTPGGVLTMQPYRLGGEHDDSLSDWVSLRALKKVIDQLPRSSFRETLRQMYLSGPHADRAFQRLCAVAEPEMRQNLRQALKGLGTDGGLWQNTGDTAKPYTVTPLHDALELHALEGKQP